MFTYAFYMYMPVSFWSRSDLRPQKQATKETTVSAPFTRQVQAALVLICSTIVTWVSLKFKKPHTHMKNYCIRSPHQNLLPLFLSYLQHVLSSLSAWQVCNLIWSFENRKLKNMLSESVGRTEDKTDESNAQFFCASHKSGPSRHGTGHQPLPRWNLPLPPSINHWLMPSPQVQVGYSTRAREEWKWNCFKQATKNAALAYLFLKPYPPTVKPAPPAPRHRLCFWSFSHHCIFWPGSWQGSNGLKAIRWSSYWLIVAWNGFEEYV